MNFLFNLLGGLNGQTVIYLVLVFGGFSSGFYIEHIRFVDFQDKVKIVAEQHIAENKSKLKEQELINRGVTDAYNANVSNIHNFYNRMLDTNSGVLSPKAMSQRLRRPAHPAGSRRHDHDGPARKLVRKNR